MLIRFPEPVFKLITIKNKHMKNHFSSFGFILLFYVCSCNSGSNTKTQNDAINIREVKSVFINGDSLHYVDIGKGDPVVFVHGGLGDYRTWDAQMDEFAKNHRVIAYSRRYAYPNKQTVSESADFSVTPNSKDLTEFIKALKLEPVHLVGHSYGAFTALLTTIEHPDLVRSLTLGEPPVMSLLPPPSPNDANPFAKAVEAIANNEQEKAVSNFLGVVTGDSVYFSKLPQRDREIMMANITELKGVLYTQNPFPMVTCDDLRNIKTPVKLVTGEKSPLFFNLIIKELDRCLSNREKAILPNTTHGLEYENPSEFNKEVLAFIDKH